MAIALPDSKTTTPLLNRVKFFQWALAESMNIRGIIQADWFDPKNSGAKTKLRKAQTSNVYFTVQASHEASLPGDVTHCMISF